MKLVLRLVVHLFCSSVNDRKESCKLNNLGPIELDILFGRVFIVKIQTYGAYCNNKSCSPVYKQLINFLIWSEKF